MSTTTVIGGKELLTALEARRDAMLQAAAAAVYQFCLMVIATADRIVPVDTGRLRASHFVSLPELQSNVVRVVMGYGTNYALAVHELIFAHHEHGQAKYLELAMAEHAQGMAAWIAAKIDENLRNGVRLQAAAMPTEPLQGADLAKAAHHERKRAHRERKGQS